LFIAVRPPLNLASELLKELADIFFPRNSVLPILDEIKDSRLQIQD
jgi:hypothetical protein